LPNSSPAKFDPALEFSTYEQAYAYLCSVAQAIGFRIRKDRERTKDGKVVGKTYL
jgi:hypothetical protein